MSNRVLRLLSLFTAGIFYLLGVPGARAEVSGIALQDLGYRMKHWAVDDGLPSGVLFSVVQTPDGYLWVSSLRGLSRFDGTTFKVFRNPSEDQPIFNRPTLRVDSEGRLWILSVGGSANHLYSYEDGEFRQWGVAEGIPEARLEFATGSESPHLIGWVDGVYRVFRRGENGAFHSIPNLKDFTSALVLQDRDGSEWGSDATRGLFRFDAESSPQAVELRGPEDEAPTKVFDLLKTLGGDSAALTDVGIFVRRDDLWELERKFNTALEDLARGGYDRLGNVWIAARKGIQVATPGGSVHFIDPSPIEQGMSAPFCDREGCIWIPSKRGLYQFVPSAFTTWTMESGVIPERVYDVSQDGEGRMWFAAEKGVYFLPPGGSRIQPVPGSSFSSYLVVGSAGPGAYLSGRSFQYVNPTSTTSLGRLSDHVERALMWQARDGTLWTADRKGLVRISEPDHTFDPLPLSPPNSEKSIHGMVQDSAGNTFLAIHGRGLVQFEEGQNLRDVGAPRESPVAKRITGLLADPEDNIWVASNGPFGLGIWNQTEQHWSFAEWSKLEVPFPIPGNLGMNCDREGGFWLTTTAGLLRADRGELVNAVRMGGGDVAWQQFDREDGLATSACSFHSEASYLDPRGRLWIPTDAGVSVTDPAAWHKTRDQIPPPPMRITRVRIDQKDTPLGGPGPIEIPPGSITLEIDYVGLHFSNPARIAYRYRLAGDEDTWIEAGNRRSAFFQKLPAGQYEFQAIADNGFGIWNETGAILPIVILPMWWQRTSVRVAGVALLLFAGFFAYRVRMRRVRRGQALQEAFSQGLLDTQEAERKRIATELHDSLGQNLLVIKNGLALEGKRCGENPQAREGFERFAKVAGDCLSEVRQISQNLRPHQIDRLGLKVAIESVVDRVASVSGMQISHEIAELDGMVNPQHEIHVLRIAQEALANAVRHSDASQIAVGIRNMGSGLDLRIQDDGKGFDPAEARTRRRTEGGMGLGDIMERTRILKGTCQIQSKPGEGCLVTILIPKKQPSR